MKQFKKTKLAAAVGTAALAAGLSAPANAVVVVGGDNGWEISFDGNINAFLTFTDHDGGHPLANTLGLPCASTAPGCTGGNSSSAPDVDSVRVHSGFLPAFFSFNAKSPTVNGLTGTARISFAPTINNGGAKTQFYATNANDPQRGGVLLMQLAVVSTVSRAPRSIPVKWLRISMAASARSLSAGPCPCSVARPFSVT